MKLRWLAAILLLAVASAALAQPIYRWVDEKGRVRYTAEKPPANVEARPVEDRVQSVSTPTISGKSYAFTPSPEARRAEVKLFTTVWCRFCKDAKDYFARNNVRYTELDIEKSPVALAEFRNHGGRGVPLTVVGSMRMSGFGEAAMADLLKKGGY